MPQRVPITIRLESFEGPLDLLLYLIQSHEFDISTVSIGKITDQYLDYVRLMQELNFDIASEFLVMAATLLHWKSKALLPQEGSADANAQGEDSDELSQEELVRQLLEHERFRSAGADLAQFPRLGEDVFSRPNKKPPVEKIWRQLDITALALGYQDILVRARKRSTILKKETVSLTEKIIDFADRLKIGEVTPLSKLLSAIPTRPDVVITFLASLELARLKRLRLYQNETYAPIYVELLESLKNFDLSLASGFDAPQPKADSPKATEAPAPDGAPVTATQAPAPEATFSGPTPGIENREFSGGEPGGEPSGSGDSPTSGDPFANGDSRSGGDLFGSGDSLNTRDPFASGDALSSGSPPSSGSPLDGNIAGTEPRTGTGHESGLDEAARLAAMSESGAGTPAETGAGPGS